MASIDVSKEIPMRTRSLIACALVLLTVLAPVSGAGQQETAAAVPSVQPSQLKILVPQSPGIPEGVQALADAYMKLHPEVTVTIRSVPFNRYREQLQVMWASNDVDDIITTGSPEIVNYAYYGALLPIDDILPPAVRSRFIKSSIDAVTFEGKIYAYPFREAASALFYNKDYFEMAGITPAPIDKPWTWPEWVEKVTLVRNAVKQKTGKDIWGLTFLANPGRGDFWLTPIIRSNSTKGSPTYQAVSPDGMKLTGYADTPEALEAYRFYQKLYTEYKLAPTAEVPDAFGSGQSATFMSFISSANELKRKFPDTRWGLMPVPYFKTPLVHTGGFTYAISAKSRNPGVAKDFIQFACSDEGIGIYLKTSGSDLLSRIGYAEAHPEYFGDEAQIFFTKILERYGESRPATPGYVLYNTIMGFNLFLDLATGADVERP
jgi:fructooligosaccharide transport system substrate-binding protein